MSDLARLASFQGRAGRSAFWWAVIGAALLLAAPISTGGLLSLVGLPAWSPMAALDSEGTWAVWQVAASAAWLAVLPIMAWLLMAALVKRCHDRNWSGWFLLVGVVPVVQIWPLIELGFLAGSRGDNGYGASCRVGIGPERVMALNLSDPPPVQLVASIAGLAHAPAPAPRPEELDPFTIPVERPVPESQFDEPPLVLERRPDAAAPIVKRAPRAPLMFMPLLKYAQFEGRATRREYWLFQVLLWLINLVFLVTLSNAIPAGREAGPFLVLGMLTLMVVLFIPSLAVTSRRLHDSGLSFAWWLVIFLPLVGWLLSLVFLLLGGARGPNRYGPDPRAA